MRAADVDMASLPDDPASLRALLVAVAAERDALVAERNALSERNERLQHLLEKLRRMQFGKRSERLPKEQLLLAFEEIEACIAEAAAEAGKSSQDGRAETVRRRRAGRGRLPAHLPRIEEVVVPESIACPCCRGAMVEIGSDTSERLDVTPAQFRVLVTRRPKFACRACPGTVLQAPAPTRLVEGGMPTEAMVAHVVAPPGGEHAVEVRVANSRISTARLELRLARVDGLRPWGEQRRWRPLELTIIIEPWGGSGEVAPIRAAI